MSSSDGSEGGRSSPVSLRNGYRRLGRATFGDRTGLAIFLGTLCFVGIYWRAGVFITDTETLVVTLEALADGHFWIDRVSENHFQAPGAVIADGLVYGRNYGQVLLSLPILWGLAAVERVADLRVALTALWHLVLLAFAVQVGRITGKRRTAALLAAPLVLASFLLNLALAEQFVDVSRPLLALQLGTIFATGLLATTTYRLVARRHGRSVGIPAGVAAGLVLPIGFWASLPKRHVIVALLLVGILYALMRSRDARTAVRLPIVGQIPGYRALAYALVGLLAWVHAAEAVFVLVALAIVDLPTAPRNDGRTLAVLAIALGLASLPTFVTNVLISGDPLVAPRMLTPADSHSVSGGAGGLSSRISEARDGAFSGIFLLDRLVSLGAVILSQAYHGLLALFDPDRFVQTWFRSGSEQFLGGGRPEFAGSNLAVLESAPVLGALVGLTAGLVRRGGSLRGAVKRIEPTDALAVSLTLAFVLLYAARLPVHVQITVRYLLPVYPLLLVLLVRGRIVRRLLVDHRRSIGWSYAAGVLLGSQLLLTVVVLQGLTVAAAVQAHAQLALVLAGLLAAAMLATLVDDRAEPLAAIGIGLAAAAGTAFVLLSGLAYFSFIGEHVLPIADAISDIIGRV
mgnify:FL=1